MNDYSKKLKLTIPVDFIETAKRISRAMDPDVGGYDSWTPDVEGENIVSYSTETPCTEEFYEQAVAMISDAEMTYQAVAFNYSQRWGDLEAPTLEECQEFCSNVVHHSEIE